MTHSVRAWQIRVRRALPLVMKFAQDILWRQIEVELRRAEMIVAQDELERSRAASAMNEENREGMPKNVRGTWPGDSGPVGHSLHYVLDHSLLVWKGIVQDEVGLEDRAQPRFQ